MDILVAMRICSLIACFATSLAAAPLLSAAGPAFAQGALHVYNWTDYTVEGQNKAFEKATGIKLKVTTYNTNEILDAKLRVGQWGYDVVVPSATPFFVQQIRAGLFHKLDRSKLRNWGNLDPEILAALAGWDPGNAHGIPFTWGTIGTGYNVAEVKKRMADAPVDSLRMIFDPAVVSKFKDCGVMLLDSPSDVFPAALKYLGLNPDSKEPKDLKRAADAVRAIHPYVAKYESLEYIFALGDGEACLVHGFAGGVYQARERAAKADKTREIAYVTPREGSQFWIDVAAIPKDAPNPDNAHRYLDFLMDPAVAARSIEETGYAFANKAAMGLLRKETLENPVIFPPRDVRAKFYTISAGTAEQERDIDRLWAAIKRGR